MIDFDVIHGMDWLHASYASINCRTHISVFQFPNEPTLQWKGGSSSCNGQFIFYIKARKMISNGCIYDLVRVGDVTSKNWSLKLFPIVNGFLEELPDIPPKI